MILAHQDLRAARRAIAEGRSCAAEAMDLSLAAADHERCARAFIRRFDAQARVVADAVDRQFRAGVPLPALAGLAVSIKDLFDVHGQPTTGGSATLAGAAAAVADCPAVARLRAAGAALLGHTNLSEFAFSGVGINPHHGTPVNAGTAAIDAVERAPGGSTSGGASSVAAGAAWAALGSDTGGSIRIPAALQGLVGFKNTQRLTPLEGCIPLSPTLDTSCAITRSVGDAILLHELLSSSRVRPDDRPAQLLRLAFPTTLMMGDLDEQVAAAFQAAVARLRQAGARVDEIKLPALDRLAAVNGLGGFAAAESWAWHRARMAVHGPAYDPRVAARIRRGQAIGAADYFELLQFRRAWIAEVEAAVAGYDALISPTVPLVAPPLAPLLASDDEFFAINARLLRNTAVVNFFDGCALSIPCHEPGQLPVGLMLWGPALADHRILGIGQTLEPLLPGAAWLRRAGGGT